MKIKTKMVYMYDGQEYPSPAYIKTHIENKIGNIIDNFDVTLTPRQKLKIHKGIVEDKELLVKLLSVELDVGDEPLAPNLVNILDY
jgi:hypothetical protein